MLHDVFCDFVFSYCFFPNNANNSGGVPYDGSKYKSSLFNVYDLLDGVISWIAVIQYVEDLSMWWLFKFNAPDIDN